MGSLLFWLMWTILSALYRAMGYGRLREASLDVVFITILLCLLPSIASVLVSHWALDGLWDYTPMFTGTFIKGFLWSL